MPFLNVFLLPAALKCPQGSHYSPCGPACPQPSCQDPAGPGGSCNLPCVEGCFCNKGLILSGDKCVPFNECGCTDEDGQYRPVSKLPLWAQAEFLFFLFFIVKYIHVEMCWTCLCACAGWRFTQTDCSERCKCSSQGNVTCEPWQCSPAQECGVTDGVLDCHSTGKMNTDLMIKDWVHLCSHKIYFEHFYWG